MRAHQATAYLNALRGPDAPPLALPELHTAPPPEARTIERVRVKVEALAGALESGQTPTGSWRAAHLAIEDFRALHPKVALGRLPPIEDALAAAEVRKLLDELDVLESEG